jgi:hypothetical protein
MNQSSIDFNHFPVFSSEPGSTLNPCPLDPNAKYAVLLDASGGMPETVFALDSALIWSKTR